MIVTTQPAQPVAFIPVTINVTFETQEELNLWGTMFSFQCGIPDLICNGPTQKARLTAMMDSVLRKTPR